MKQQITLEQWGSIDYDKKQIIFDVLGENLQDGGTLCIGEMIEFLGEDFVCLDLQLSGSWVVFSPLGQFNGKEAVDSLWEAVKYKLRNK